MMGGVIDRPALEMPLPLHEHVATAAESGSCPLAMRGVRIANPTVTAGTRVRNLASSVCSLSLNVAM